MQNQFLRTYRASGSMQKFLRILNISLFIAYTGLMCDVTTPARGMGTEDYEDCGVGGPARALDPGHWWNEHGKTWSTSLALGTLATCATAIMPPAEYRALCLIPLTFTLCVGYLGCCSSEPRVRGTAMQERIRNVGAGLDPHSFSLYVAAEYELERQNREARAWMEAQEAADRRRHDDEVVLSQSTSSAEAEKKKAADQLLDLQVNPTLCMLIPTRPDVKMVTPDRNEDGSMKISGIQNLHEDYVLQKGLPENEGWNNPSPRPEETQISSDQQQYKVYLRQWRAGGSPDKNAVFDLSMNIAKRWKNLQSLWAASDANNPTNVLDLPNSPLHGIKTRAVEQIRHQITFEMAILDNCAQLAREYLTEEYFTEQINAAVEGEMKAALQKGKDICLKIKNHETFTARDALTAIARYESAKKAFSERCSGLQPSETQQIVGLSTTVSHPRKVVNISPETNALIQELTQFQPEFDKFKKIVTANVKRREAANKMGQDESESAQAVKKLSENPLAIEQDPIFHESHPETTTQRVVGDSKAGMLPTLVMKVEPMLDALGRGGDDSISGASEDAGGKQIRQASLASPDGSVALKKESQSKVKLLQAQLLAQSQGRIGGETAEAESPIKATSTSRKVIATTPQIQATRSGQKS